jgi:hypothetical protein
LSRPHGCLRAALAVLGLALSSFAIWRVEVECIRGWAGLNWLRGYPWAAIPTCALVAASVLTCVAAVVPVKRGRSLPFVAVATAVVWIAFEIARRWLCEDYGYLVLVGSGVPASHWVVSPLLSVLISVFGIQQGIHRLLRPIAAWTALLFLSAVALVWPLCLLSLQIAPPHGYRDVIHAIKAGHPMFWSNITFGTAAWAAVRHGRCSTT